MSKELQIFSYNGSEVRTIEQDGEVWFVAKDVCDALGLKNPTKALKHLDDDERANFRLGRSPIHGGGGDVNIISESGLYALIFRSNKPEAKEFSRWVRHEVLPTIRKTGMYLTDSKLEQLKTDPEIFDHLLKRYAEEREKNRQLQEQIERDRPLTNLGTVVMSQKGAIMFQSAAQFLSQHGIPTGQNRLFKYCRDKKLLCSRKGRQWNKPTQKSIEAGLFNIQVSGGFSAVTMITPKGLKYLTNELVAENYPLLVLMEGEAE